MENQGALWSLLAVLTVASCILDVDSETVEQVLLRLRGELDSGTADLLARFPRAAESNPASLWHSRDTLSPGHDDLPRDDLTVTSLAQDESFTYGAGVSVWHSLTVGSSTFMVGLAPTGISLVTATVITPDVGAGQTTSFTEAMFDTRGTPLAATLFRHWNPEIKAMEAVLVLVTESSTIDINWYFIRNGRLEIIDSQPTHDACSLLKVFTIGHQYKLLTVTPCKTTGDRSACQANAKIYDFTLVPSLDMKLAQSLRLEDGATSAEIGITGDEMYLALALPLRGIVKLYRYRWPLSPNSETSVHSTYGWFETWKDFPSPGVTHAVFFHVSYKLYLAIGGGSPTLLRFVSPTQLEGCPNAMQSLGFVSAWMVLPVPTYREEIILLAQLDSFSGSLRSRRVVILTWGGVGMFKLHLQPPCIRNKQALSEGASCIIAESNELGLRGAVALKLSNASFVSLIIPRALQPSAQFLLYTHIYAVANPLLYEMASLEEMRRNLEAELAWQDQQMNEVERMLSGTLQVDGSNVISGTWVVEEIYTPQHDIVDTSRVNVAGQQGSSSTDPDVNVGGLQKLMVELRNLTKNLVQALSDAAVPVSGELELTSMQTLLGGIEVSGNSVFDSVSLTRLNGESVPHLLKDSVRIDYLDKIGGMKTVNSVEVQNVNFGKVNDVSGDELVFDTAGRNIIFDGNLSVARTLHVLGDVELLEKGTVNGIDISEEMFQPGKMYKGPIHLNQVKVEGDLTVDNVNNVAMHPYNLRAIVMGVGDLSAENDTKYDLLQIGGELKVERINGYLWEDITQRIVWRNSLDHIEGTTVIDGVLRVNQGMEVWQLNGLAFPHDYVLRTNGTQHISGLKTVDGNLSTNSADVINTIDGVPVRSLVTLSTEQFLDGELKLNKADVSGDIKVDWGINGISLDRIQKKSPALGEVGVVSSNVRFSKLEVAGKVLISGDVDEVNFKDYLSDIVLVPENPGEPVILQAEKEFRGGLSVGGLGLAIKSGLLNGASVSDFISVDTPQAFRGKKIIEQASFGNLHLTGKWDNVDVMELSADTIRLNGNQESLSHLTFENSAELWASRLLISETLNTDITKDSMNLLNGGICDISVTGKECIMNGPVTASSIRVGGNVVVDGQVCGWNLVDFETRRFSRARPQTVTGDLTIRDVQVGSHLAVSALNNVPVENIVKTLPPHTSPNLDELLAVGGFAVDELFVEGNIYTKYGVNGYNVAEVASNAVKIGENNRIPGSLIFEELVNVGLLNVDKLLNGLNVSQLEDDAVFKEQSQPVSVSGLKVFDAGVIVDGSIHTNQLSGLTPSHIVTRSKAHLLQGPLRVTGNVYAGNINLTGLMNGIHMDTFKGRYKLLSEGRHLLSGNVHFAGSVEVDDLFVIGRINGRDIDTFSSSVVIKNVPTRITGNKVFINKVIFRDVKVDNLVNGMDLKEFAEDVVIYNDEHTAVINGGVTFASALTAHDGVSLSGNLEAQELDGCLIKEWFDNAVYLDEPQHITGYKKLSNLSSSSNLKLSVLNALDLTKVIPLNKAQEIPWKVHFRNIAVRHNMDVGGLVNGRKIVTDYDNTLLTLGDQSVIGQKTFLNGMTVKGNLVTTGLVSGRDLANIVTLNQPQVIKGALRIQNMVVEGNVRVRDLISNIDIQNWKEHALLTHSIQQQTITGKWNVLGNIRYTEEVDGHGLLGGENINHLAESVIRGRKLTSAMQEDVKGDWQQLCLDTNTLLEKARRQPFLFQQLEVVQALPSAKFISSMHAFEAQDEQFLVVSYSNNCSGALYRWNGAHTAWELENDALNHVGDVQHWVTIKAADGIYLGTSSQSRICEYSGGNIWHLGHNAQFRNVHSMDPWTEADVDEEKGHLYTVGQSGVSVWKVSEGKVKKVEDLQLQMKSDPAVLHSKNDSPLTSLRNSNHSSIYPSASPYLSGSKRGSMAKMTVAGGRKLVAAAAEDSNMLLMYEDALSGQVLGRVWAHGAHSLSVLELTGPGRIGQTLLAFIEDERRLRVVEYRGMEGLVDVAVARLAVAVKEMIPVRLQARGLVNKRHFLLLRSDYQVLLVEVEMAGDPLDQPSLSCALP